MVFFRVFASHHPGHSPLHSRFCVPSLFLSTFNFELLTSSKPFTIRTSETPLPQLLYNPHLQGSLGSAGNKGLITPLESALTKNSPVSLLESALTEKWGGGGKGYPRLHFGLRRNVVDFRHRRCSYGLIAFLLRHSPLTTLSFHTCLLQPLCRACDGHTARVR